MPLRYAVYTDNLIVALFRNEDEADAFAQFCAERGKDVKVSDWGTSDWEHFE